MSAPVSFLLLPRRRLLAVAVAGLLTFMPLPFLPAHGSDAESVSTRLTVVVTGLHNHRGSVVLSLFHGGDGFPGDSKKASVSRVIPLADAILVDGETGLPIVFDGLAPGDYAIALFHDENGNEKLDTHWGIPTEGYGFSNNPKLRWGAPSYKETRFTLSVREHEATITISLKYLRGGHR